MVVPLQAGFSKIKNMGRLVLQQVWYIVLLTLSTLLVECLSAATDCSFTNLGNDPALGCRFWACTT